MNINFEKCHDLTDNQNAFLLFWVLGYCETQLNDHAKEVVNSKIKSYSSSTIAEDCNCMAVSEKGNWCENCNKPLRKEEDEH